MPFAGDAWWCRQARRQGATCECWRLCGPQGAVGPRVPDLVARWCDGRWGEWCQSLFAPLVDGVAVPTDHAAFGRGAFWEERRARLVPSCAADLAVGAETDRSA